jgi:tetratricopeptide (TPR) repeat protein
MASKKKENPGGLQDVEHALSSTEQFIEDNQKFLTIIVTVIVVLVGIFLLGKRFYINPREKEALSQMYVAEKYFERDSFNLALHGDGNYLGFLDIMSDYKMTKSSNLSKYYAGISYLHLGDYENAIRYLKKFRTRDDMVAPIATGAMGDAMAEQGELEKAASLYTKAAEKYTNDFTSPIYLLKAGEIYEKLGKADQALKLYNLIQEKYPESTEGRNIEKYITRASLQVK